MYGQMTAGSWIYIGSQGIVQGTFETFVAARQGATSSARSTRGTLWVLTAGLGGMGGAQPLAATMAGLVVPRASRSIPRASQKRLETRYVDERIDDLDEALARIERAIAREAAALASPCAPTPPTSTRSSCGAASCPIS